MSNGQTLSETTLLDVLPDSITGFDQIAALSAGLEPHRAGVVEAIPEVKIYSRLSEISDEVLAWVAWGFDVDYFSEAPDRAGQEAIVESVFADKRLYATPFAVKARVAILLDRVEGDGWEYKARRPFRLGRDVLGVDRFIFYPAQRGEPELLIDADLGRSLWPESSAAARAAIESYLSPVSAAHVVRRIQFQPFYLGWSSLGEDRL